MTVPELQYYDSENLPPEMLLDADHPANDKYIRDTEQIQRQIMHQSALLKPKHTQMVKRYFAGQMISTIAEALDCHPATVSKNIGTPSAKRLLALLYHLAAAIDGPNEAQRRAMLWRIAVKAEDDHPPTAIQALNAFDRMDTTAANKSAGPASTTININIDQATLPKTTLDA